MATISFLSGPSQIQDLSGSGLGFYGSAGFGASVQVGLWQGRTFITNGLGTTQGPECPSVQYLNQASGILGQTGSGTHLKAIPNYQATLNIRFTNPTACKTQNSVLRIFDRVNPDNPASGVTTAVAEIVHPDLTQVANGSGSANWVFPAGSGTVLNLTSSPGTSGLRPLSVAVSGDVQHDWYTAISCSPNSISSKLFGLFFQTEFL